MHNSLLWLGPARPAFRVLTFACARCTHGPVRGRKARLVRQGAVALRWHAVLALRVCLLTLVLMAIGILMS